MPNNDSTGPKGAGPMSGKGMGICNKGGCKGKGNKCCDSYSKEEELEMLEKKSKFVNDRIEELKR